MTANKRIFLNIVATYGRSLYALVIGLFAGEWFSLEVQKLHLKGNLLFRPVCERIAA